MWTRLGVFLDHRLHGFALIQLPPGVVHSLCGGWHGNTKYFDVLHDSPDNTPQYLVLSVDEGESFLLCFVGLPEDDFSDKLAQLIQIFSFLAHRAIGCVRACAQTHMSQSNRLC